MYLTFRNNSVRDVMALLKTVQTGWIILALLLLISVFFLRAARWRLLLLNSGLKAGLKDVNYSLLLGFFVNSFTPKIGEIVRCTSLHKSTGIDTAKSFGTVVSERIYDLIALVAGILIILFFESDRLGSLAGNYFRNLLSPEDVNTTKILLILAVIIVLFFIARAIFLKIGLNERIRLAAGKFLSGLRMTFRIRNFRLFLFQTIAIWAIMVLMNYCCMKSLPSTENLSLYFAMVALFIGTIGWAIPSPGGMGTSHFFILQLFLLFGLNERTGLAYGVMVNGLTVLFTIAAGLSAIIVVQITRQARKYSKNKIKF